MKIAGPVLIFLIICALLFVGSAEYLNAVAGIPMLVSTQAPATESPTNQPLASPTTTTPPKAQTPTIVWPAYKKYYLSPTATKTPTPKATKTPTPSPTKTITLKTCKSFLWQEDAQAYADTYGAGNMDGDNDGVVCEDLLSRTKYQNYNGVYKGKTCTGDCSGHEAGYNWASDHGISDASDCGGNSNSFIEGCISYVEENY